MFARLIIRIMVHQVKVFKICLLLVIIALGVFALSISQRNSLPEDVQALVDQYMEAYKFGTKEAAQYAHFESELIRVAYLDAATILIDYRLESTERVNDDLYALTVLVKTNYTGNAYLRVYNFVGYVEGQWRYMNGIGNIPEGIRDNLDEDRYTYSLK